MASENSCYIVTCPVNLLLEKVVKRNVTKKCVLFLSYMYTYIYIYINVLPQPLNKNESYLYDDDTCIFNQVKDVEKIEKSLTQKSFVTK